MATTATLQVIASRKAKSSRNGMAGAFDGSIAYTV